MDEGALFTVPQSTKVSSFVLESTISDCLDLSSALDDAVSIWLDAGLVLLLFSFVVESAISDCLILSSALNKAVSVWLDAELVLLLFRLRDLLRHASDRCSLASHI
jgi:hypothetical protein